jgi:hypothetical protein
MPVPQATLGRVAKLQPDATATNGVKVIVGGDGTRFFLIKDAAHLWGLWQGTNAGIEPVYVPLPGTKHSEVDAVIPWDGLMVVYLLSRVTVGTTNYHPLHHVELSAPQFKAQVWRGDIAALKQQDIVLVQQLTVLDRETDTLTARLDAVERALGSTGDPALEGRVVALENAIKGAGAILTGE